MEKVPITKIRVRNKRIKKIIRIIKKCESFLFISYIDPDALGSMLALGLVLKRLHKTVAFYMPDKSNEKVKYLSNIINYNDINIILSPEGIKPESFDCLIFNDTANRKVIPYYKHLESIFNNRKISVIETDHHFGTDSARVARRSVTLFEKANANCEIITKILYKMNNDKEIKNEISNDTLFKRNILLCLLTGIISDTQFGKYLINKKQYHFFMQFLSLRLELSTFSRHQYFQSPKDIYKYLVELSEENIHCVDILISHAEKRKHLNILDLTDSSPFGGISAVKQCEYVDLEDINDILANKLPELHGNIGSLILEKDIEGTPVKYIKIRRSMSYKGFNIKSLESHFIENFGELYIGGGGHEGACSFRVTKSSAEDFYQRLNAVFAHIQ